MKFNIQIEVKATDMCQVSVFKCLLLYLSSSNIYWWIWELRLVSGALCCVSQVSHRITVEYSVEVVRLMSPHELERAKRSAEVPLQIDDEFSKSKSFLQIQTNSSK